ncbi:YD repeat-containing protein [Luteibacter sp. Sphag1AF]|uniref:RHS repeat domain-containing protein n=1 Tax=Luteibacter sp. Sphag1AF TaxID=2587031 RepID=UPI00160FD7E5|nr:RHS repeat domain-containing protein [Luteibacter sp. Sphag1AF]MBB3227129.1 YD repeat-containing protein [Luteibacter sp. Sphag1AF]
MDCTFSAQGQLASFTDDNGKTTTLGGFAFGIPDSVAYTDATSQTVAVDGFGQIASLTDQAGVTTSYGYDAIGRTVRIDYPSGDSVAWAPKTYSYSYVVDGRGLRTAHWVRNTKQGALTQQTDFDALLTPVMAGKSEADTSALSVSARTEYDRAGRTTFESLP